MDKIYIYKYTNKLNGHVYIGKTNNVARRQREHRSNAYNPSSSFYNSLWCKKIREYGYDNFTFEVIEETDSEHWREREQYWIAYYNSFYGAGYNRDRGGDGKDERIKSLTDEQLLEIIELLKTTDEPQSIIGSYYNISPTLMSNINNGFSYRQKNIQYPIRKNYNTFEDYRDLVEDIKHTTIPFTELQKKYGYGYSTIKKINEGKLLHQDNENYPLRKINADEEKALRIKELLMNSNLPMSQIAYQCECSSSTVSRINKGITHYDPNLNYPLRKPVSTIS